MLSKCDNKSMKMDVLRELSDEELENIKIRLKNDLPRSIKNLYYINSAEIFKVESSKYSNLSVKALPKFYTLRDGKEENYTIFGITGDENHTVWYFTDEKSLSEVRKCLEGTKLIKWRKGTLFVTLHAEHVQPVLDYAASNKIEVFNEICCYQYLPIEVARNFEIEIPEDVNLVKLQPEDATTCNNSWKFKDANSELWIKSLIMVHGGWALRDKITHEILSYAIINDHLAIGVLVTVEKAQRKGYAQIIIKCLAKMLAEKNLTPTIFTNMENERALKLFEKLGFIKIGGSNWISIL